MVNQYGLDASYFKNKLKIILEGTNSYTPHELARELTRLACTAEFETADSEMERLAYLEE